MSPHVASRTTLPRCATALLGLGGMLALSACGGGAGDGETTPTAVPRWPHRRALPPRTESPVLPA